MRIDVHHHISPPDYLAAARGPGHTHEAALAWTPAQTIEEMGKADIDIAILSMSGAGVWFGDAAKACALARSCNEFAARMSADHPGRFGNLAVLPIPDVEGCLREIDYAYDSLGVDGIGIRTSYNGKWLGDPLFQPIYEELNRRRAVVHVHPLTPPACANLIPWVSDTLLEFLFDTARAITSLLFSGTAARYPDIRFIFSHAGGALPTLVDRIERRVTGSPELRALMPEGAIGALRRFHYDTATSSVETNLGDLLKIVPASRILFGTDLPYVAAATTLAGLDGFTAIAEHRKAIEADNALALFPRLKVLTRASVA